MRTGIWLHSDLEKGRSVPAGITSRSKTTRGSLAAPGFDLGVSMGCGQVFGWVKEDGAYTGIIAGSGRFDVESRGFLLIPIEP